ncbi:hypothetical protein Tco_1251146 [Tanacetum coccineum]
MSIQDVFYGSNSSGIPIDPSPTSSNHFENVDTFSLPDPSLGCNLEKIHVNWDHLGKKRTRLRLYNKSFEETVHTERGDGVANYK